MIKNRPLIIGVILSALVLSACKKEEKKAADKTADRLTASPEGNAPDSVNLAAEEPAFQPETADETTAEKLKLYLRDYLKADLPSLEASDRKFSFYAIDLNNDKKDEYFISLSGRGFCGSGGCTFLLLDNNLKLINRFTVMRGPVFRSSSVTDGWNDLILKGSNNKYIHLKWDAKAGKYPSNPSVVKETDIAPAGHDFIMWDDDFSRAKPFTF
ncbi:hypothetical protein F3J23_12790 [Chryseobacterium sp. Tr-659]|uniref:hypothetical protein n=1 Tax=Chryseobacterium sp. Tr-659 TaxID=2608340 RepID=UPI00141EA508|nr:hypothetical protein [Chryseobacterium sp. Tr-659]NIF06316.1 hypothetical protein [Chryseobacterium sp. Tr-659]